MQNNDFRFSASENLLLLNGKRRALPLPTLNSIKALRTYASLQAETYGLRFSSYTANLGGKIRHTELRGDALAATDEDGEAEEENKDEGGSGRGRHRRGRDN